MERADPAGEVDVVGDRASASTGTTAFVLPGGGSLGAVQVGMIRALDDAGIRPDLLVGTSIGAFNAALYALTELHDGTIARLERVWGSITRRDVVRVDLRHLALALAGRRDSFLSNRNLTGFLRELFRDARLEHARVPLVVTATDIAAARPVAIDHGPAVPALLASTALPGILPPVERDGRLLVDGGLSAAWPVHVAIERGATDVYVLQTASCETTVLHRNPFAMFERGIDVLSDRTVELERQAVPGHVRVHEITPPPSRVSILDLSTTRELIANARAACADWLHLHHKPVTLAADHVA